MLTVDSDWTSSFTSLSIQPSFLKEHNDTSWYKLKTVGVNRFRLRLVHLTSVMSPYLCKSLPLSNPQTLGNECAQFPSPSLLSHSLSYIARLQTIHQRIQTTRSHASRFHLCHCWCYCNVDYVLFYNVTRYTNSLLSSCIHVNTAHLLNTTCMHFGWHEHCTREVGVYIILWRQWCVNHFCLTMQFREAALIIPTSAFY